MSTEPSERHLKFYGLNDLGTFYQATAAIEVLEQFDHQRTDYLLEEIIELHNAKQFIEAGVFPSSCTETERDTLRQSLPSLQRTIGTFFNRLDDVRLASLDGPLHYDYYPDLLELFARNKIYSRCTPAAVLSLIDRLELRLQDMLASHELVVFCSEELRLRLISEAVNAELLVRKHLEQDSGHQIHLPACLTKDDAASLINKYLESDDPHPNTLKLISLARTRPEIGLDPRTKLKAKRRYERSIEEFFANNSGMRTSCEVSLSSEQQEPVKSSSVDGETKFSYSQQWLENNLDYPTILNNFIFLFDFVDDGAMLLLPSFLTEISALQGAMSVSARDGYRTGITFRFKDQLHSMQVHLYLSFLRDRDIELEGVIAWFFGTQAAIEFGANGFIFTPSSSTSTYLERCRHLFSEMESVLRQYKLYVEDDEIDSELLGISSEQVQYKSIPSLLSGKYLYASDQQDIGNILHLLFSDQAGLGYIHEGLRDNSGAALLVRNQMSYEDFHPHQQAEIDYLVDQGILVDVGARVEFTNYHQLVVLKDLFDHEAASYYHYPVEARPAVDEMVQKGWLTQGSTLLSQAEANYLNYMLNQSEFSNGPDLRNKYLHGSQANASGENEHFRTYIIVIKLLIALVIKINDDLCLREAEAS